MDKRRYIRNKNRPELPKEILCFGCNKILLASEFGLTGRGGLKTRCKPCARKHHREYHKTEAGIRSRKNTDFKKFYGIDLNTYNKLLEAQNGKCAICKNNQEDKTRVLSVDHNHTTGEVRSLLCGKCNLGLGMFNEDVNLLQAVIDYINRWNIHATV